MNGLTVLMLLFCAVCLITAWAALDRVGRAERALRKEQREHRSTKLWLAIEQDSVARAARENIELRNLLDHVSTPRRGAADHEYDLPSLTPVIAINRDRNVVQLRPRGEGA